MSNNVTLIELRVFMDVAATGSFSEAAIRHQVPPSSVSRHVASLERKLRQRLFYRHTRAVRLTEAGAAYLSDLRPALDLLDAATDQMTGQGSKLHGLLRINAPVAFGRMHIAPFLLAFQKQNISVEAELVLSDALIDPVAEGADIVVRVGPMLDSSLTGRVLWPQHYRICAAPSYLHERGTPVSVADLQNHECLVYAGATGSEVWHITTPLGQATRLVPPSRFRSNHAETLLDAAITGDGIVLFPNWLVATCLQDGKLVSVLNDHVVRIRADDITIHAIIPENRQRSRKVELFLEGWLRHLGKSPFWDGLPGPEGPS